MTWPLRLLWIVGLVLAFCAVSSVFATTPPGDIPAVPEYYWVVPSSYGNCNLFSGQESIDCYTSAEASAVLADPAHSYLTYAVGSEGCWEGDTSTAYKYYCAVTWNYTTNNGPGSSKETIGATRNFDEAPADNRCPVNSSTDPADTSGLSCKCDSGYMLGSDAASCVADPNQAKNPDGSLHAAWPNGCQPGSDSSWDGDVALPGYTPGASVCVAGCVASPGAAWQKGGSWYGGAMSATGGTCDAATGPPTPVSTNPTDPQVCTPSSGQAMCPGSVNGQFLCVPCGTATATNGVTTSTSTDASGNTTSGSTVKTTTVDNGDGTVTTTTTTTNADGTFTTSVSTQPKAPAGNAGSGSASSPQPDSFCTQNPSSPICKPSSFEGACTGGFSCSGDAIQCAIAQDQHMRNCQFFQPTSDQTKNFDQAVTDGDNPSWSPANTANAQTTNIDLASQLDTTNPYAADCLADQVVSLSVGTATIPWSKLCSSMQLMGHLVVAAALMMAAFVVFK